MVRQDRISVIAEVVEDRVDELRGKLASLTRPGLYGSADPDNPLLPFSRYPTIHFARLVVLADHSLADRAEYSALGEREPTHLLLLIDCDGDGGVLLDLIAREQPQLKDIFDCCVGAPRGDLGGWLKARRVKPIASYVNWIGRTVTQVREEAALRAALRAALPKIAAGGPNELRKELKARVAPNVRLTPLPEVTLSERIADLFGILWPLALALACLLLFPLLCFALLVIGGIAFAVMLRRRELGDPVQQNAYDSHWVELLRRGEDLDVTNPYTAMGSIRPGRFRLIVARVALSAIHWAARYLVNRGGLGRIATIHFAHWIFLDGDRRMVFCSNYDGLHESYMDDFINKAGFGLNLSFSGAIAYPQTDWMIARGAWREQEFKRFQRYHQIPTDVWYRAYPGLTARDIAANALVRSGFEREDLDDDETRRWLAEI
jgi:hypothetical protein